MGKTERPDLIGLSSRELLALYPDVLDELHRRGLIRSKNNPVADYAEHLAAKAFDLKLANKSNTGYDGIGPDGLRYEVKARRITADNPSRMLSAIRGLDKRHFDVLLGIVFNRDFGVLRACTIPVAVVEELATYRKHTNAWVLHLRDKIWERNDVRDVTDQIKQVEPG